MKNLLMSLLSIFIVSSCTTERENDLNEDLQVQKTTLTDSEFAKVKSATQIPSDEFTASTVGNNFFTSDASSVKDKMIAEFQKTNKKAPVINGPYYYTVGVPAPNPTNQKVIYTQVGGTYPPSGVYFADIYSYYMKVALPANAVTGWIDSVDNPGYANYSTQTMGFNSSSPEENGVRYVSGNTYTMGECNLNSV